MFVLHQSEGADGKMLDKDSLTEVIISYYGNIVKI